MLESSRYVEFFHALKAASPAGARGISSSGVAIMALIYAADGRTLAPRAIAQALGLSYTSAWNIADRLRAAGFVRREGKAWGLTEAGVRLMDVLAGVDTAAARQPASGSLSVAE